ncbi:hypothetical protein ET495_14880 [Xylanimonas allomyrinae]|uniref:CBM-cenC domain-containing protein n=1 Tax=Xylanimonas allomyrinae TaxID=2509459 RepID=A0A4P6EP91_9MICO|nr:glycosyl hydrolase family 8 [Xylanimonas allomyrinae]QAY64276.1 hypothetical protein ET495_14880 [Xylanimonas allomyrinae]
MRSRALKAVGVGGLVAALAGLSPAGLAAAADGAGPTPSDVVLSETFDDGTLGVLSQSGSPTLTFVDADAGKALQVSGRAQTWDTVQSPAGIFSAGVEYTLSARVRLVDEAPGSVARFTLDDGSYTPVGAADVGTGAWTEISGTYTLPGPGAAATTKFSIEAGPWDGSVKPSFLVDDVLVTAGQPSTPTGPLPTPGTVVLDSGFEDGLDGWVPRMGSAGDHVVEQTGTDAHGGAHAALVTGRTSQGSGIGHDTTGLLVPGATYTVTAWVRFPDGAPVDSVWLTHQRVTGASTTFVTLGQFSNVTNTEWNQVSAQFTMPAADSSLLYFETRYTATGGNTSDFLVDDVRIAVAAPEAPVTEDPDVPFVPLERPGPVPATTGAAQTGVYRNLFTEWDPALTDADVQAKLDHYWETYFTSTDDDKRLYYPAGTDADGDLAYILDAGNEDVRSEGMSYGMMIAVQMGKQHEFDALWNWATTYMQHQSGPRQGYFCWQAMTDGQCADPNPASDGEEYFATALFFAAHRWGNGTGIYDYEAQANAILDTMLHKEDMNGGVVDGITNMFDRDHQMVVFVPEGNAATYSDPSYHVPAFYELWGRWAKGWNGNTAADRQFWLDAAARSRQFFGESTHPSTGLAPDYANFDGTPKDSGNHADFRFDAWRTAVNWSVDNAWWAKDDAEQALSNRIQSFFERKGLDTYANQYALVGKALSTDHSPGLVASNGVASLAATDSRAWKFVEELWNLEPATGRWRYYDGLLNFMALLHTSGHFQAWGPAEEPVTPPVVEPTTPPARTATVSVPQTATPGQTIPVTVGTDWAGETVQVWLHSTPRHLVTGAVRADGTIEATIPADTALGTHSIVVLDAAGVHLGAAELQIVAAPAAATPTPAAGTLPITGVDGTALAVASLLAIALAGAGGLMVRHRRRRTVQ